MKAALIILLVLAVLTIPIPISIKYPKEKKPEKARTEEKEKPKKPKKQKKNQLFKDFPWFQFAKIVVPKIPRPIKYLIRHTSVAKISLEMCIVGSDASDTAIKYGSANAAVYGILALLQNVIDIKPKKIVIFPDFCGGKSKIDFSAKIRIIPLCVIISIIPLLFAILGAFIQVKKEKK